MGSFKNFFFFTIFVLICLYWPCKAPLGEWSVIIIIITIIIIIVIIIVIIIIIIIIIISITIIIIIIIVLTNVTFVVNIRKRFDLQWTDARKHL